MNDLQVFKNSEFGELGVLQIDGKEYFPATACAKALGYTNPQKAIKDHCKDPGVTKRSVGVRTGIKQDGSPALQDVEMKFINEGNLYRLIVSSKLPSAEKFERWVFDEVLPSIRKQGGYVHDMREIITQTATVVATEVLRQIIPALGECLKATQTTFLPETSAAEPMPRKKVPGIIEKLDPELQQEVEQMLCSRRYTYSDIVKYLAEFGITLSVMSVHRYAKSIFR